MTRGKKGANYLEWTKQWETGESWFKRLRAKKGSKDSYLKKCGYGLYRFAEFKGKNPDEIFAEYKALASEDLDKALEEIDIDLDTFINWLCEKFKIARSSAVVRHAQIKSWLKYNSKLFRGRFGTPDTWSKKIPPIVMEDLRELVPALDARETFFTMFLKDSGVSQAEAVRFDYGQLRKPFEKGEQYIHIHVIREKEHVDYETWIGPNTVQALKAWLNVRKQRGETITDETPLFASNLEPYHRLSGQGLSQVFLRITQKTGTKISTHRIRKLFETRMATAKVHPVTLKYWAGHKVRSGKSDVEGKYIIPTEDEQRKEYVEAYDKIDMRPQRDQVDQFIAETNARMAGMTPEQRQRYKTGLRFRLRGASILNHPEVKKLLEERDEPADGMLPATPEFNEITEKELLVYLQNGWQIVHNLQNGNVIIRKG